jgi:hypothetical protein
MNYRALQPRDIPHLVVLLSWVAVFSVSICALVRPWLPPYLLLACPLAALASFVAFLKKLSSIDEATRLSPPSARRPIGLQDVWALTRVVGCALLVFVVASRFVSSRLPTHLQAVTLSVAAACLLGLFRSLNALEAQLEEQTPTPSKSTSGEKAASQEGPASGLVKPLGGSV